MSLLISVVLGDEVQVLASDDHRTVHLRRNNGTGQDTSADGNLTGERALVVYVAETPRVRTLFSGNAG